MANIEKELKAIMEAEYGEEVRSSIHDAIKAGNDEIVEYGLKEKERSEAEAERSEAETARMAAEAERRQAETERAGAETVRATEESARKTAEEARIVAETERSEAEEVREQSETARMSAETERVLEENERQQRESVRISGENERLEAERYRVQEEVLRAQAEATRIAAEELREEVKAAAEAAAEAANEAAKRADEAATGGVSKMIVNFEEPEEPKLLETGETVGTLFGKLSGWIRKIRIELNENILLRAYPVGTIYMSVSEVNPGTLFGGTWEVWGSGRMPLGVNVADIAYNTAGKTGGSSTHVHTSPQHVHGINSHSHTSPQHVHSINSHVHTGPSHIHSTGDCTLTINQIPSHRHTVARTLRGQSGSSITVVTSYDNDSSSIRDTVPGSWAGGSMAHNHGNTGYAGNGNTGGTALTTNNNAAANTGGITLTTNNNAAANTGSASSYPPYITCYMWKRIS